MAIPRLLLSDFVPAGGHFHIARVCHRPRQGTTAHQHDFCEVFWIEAGAGKQQINGQERSLAAGDIVFIRPFDTHAIWSGGCGLTLVNVAMSAAHAERCQGTYLPLGQRPWSREDQPVTLRLPPASRKRLWQEAMQLSCAGDSPYGLLQLDRFLLDLLNEIVPTASGGPTPLQTPPVWLQDAVTTLAQRPHLLSDGVGALVAQSARSREHVSRMVRQVYGMTASSLVNELRLRRVAHELQMTARTVTEVAMAAGFGNLGYFYRCFRRRFNATPRAWRRRNQSIG